MKLCVVLRKWGWGLMVMIALLVIFPSYVLGRPGTRYSFPSEQN